MKKPFLVLFVLQILTFCSCSNYIDKYQDANYAKVSSPAFNYSGGNYNYDLNVEITCPTNGAIIYYTTDGTEPDIYSTQYTSPIPVTGLGSSVTITAFAVKNGLSDSEIASATYRRTGEIARNAVGATDSTDLRTLDYIPDDNNSIFVSKSTGNDISGTGSQDNPVASINKAITITDAGHSKVLIQDSEIYEESGFEFIDNFTGLFSALGQKPIFRPLETVDLRSIADVVPNTVFDANSISGVSAARLNNGNWVCCYTDLSNNYGKFVIYNQSGQLVSGPTTFDTDNVFSCSVSVLTGGRWVCGYYRGSNYEGYFVIYNENGTVSTGPTVFEATSSFCVSTAGLNNGNFVIAYEPNDISATHGRFVIYNAAGVHQAGPITFGQGVANVCGFSIGVLSNNNFVVCYGGANSTSYGIFYIFTQTGTAVAGPIAFDNTNSVGRCSVSVLSNGNWVCCYNSGGYGKYVIYNQAGSHIAGPTNFSSGYTSYFSSTSMTDEWACSYCDQTDGSRGKVKIYSNSGTELLRSTRIDPTPANSIAIEALTDDTIVSCFNNTNAGQRGSFKILYTNAWSGINISNNATINGVVIDADGQDRLTKLINIFPSASATIQYCNMLNTANPVQSIANINGYGLFSYGIVNILNSKFYNNDCGAFVSSNSAIVSDTLFYYNLRAFGLHILGSAVNSGDITLSHCDFFNNYIGLRLENNNGGNEIIKNSIFHDNIGYGINADNSVAITNSVITNSALNAAFGIGVSTNDPLYVNEGVPDINAVDLNIQSILTGFPVDSPAKGLADDSRNAGAYDIEYIE